MFSFPECVTWLAIGLTESVAMVTLNIITIIVFIKSRNLRKRSTYLVIHLVVVDMLAGGTATFDVYQFGVFCNLLKFNFPEGWLRYVIVIILTCFPVCSITNVTAISVERLHATLRPFRHRVIKKFVYGVVISVVWVAAGLLVIVMTRGTLEFKATKSAVLIYVCISYFALCLLVICVSYSSIVIKVRCGAQPQHHGAVSRERKLTMTLLIVTVISLLLYLPYIIAVYLGGHEIISSMSMSSRLRITRILSGLFYANSLVNPILYAIRMPEYRSAVLALFRRRPQQQRQAEVLPLDDM